MALRFNRRIRIVPGLTLNVGKRGVSASVGTTGAKVTIGPTGVRRTIGLPGTGLSDTELVRPQATDGPPASAPQTDNIPIWLVVVIVVLVVAFLTVRFMLTGK